MKTIPEMQQFCKEQAELCQRCKDGLLKGEGYVSDIEYAFKNLDTQMEYFISISEALMDLEIFQIKEQLTS